MNQDTRTLIQGEMSGSVRIVYKHVSIFASSRIRAGVWSTGAPFWLVGGSGAGKKAT